MNFDNYLKLVLSFSLLPVCFTFFEYSSYENHACKRDCSKDSAKLLCRYNFTVEWYSTLSKACYNCPSNRSDCNRKDCVAANGVVRAVMVVNRMLPGPAIEVCEGDTVSVKVFNNLHLSEETSIHWHGILQKGTQYMDGVGMITQCAIPTYSSFEYRFQVVDRGTHLWHSHSGLQRADGVFGAFIVRERTKRYDYGYDYDLSEHVIMLNDWINQATIEKFVAHHHNDGNNKPDSILINGKGLYSQYRDQNLTNKLTPTAVFRVKYGFKYRFRVINGGILYCPLKLFIDGHNLSVISTDGNDVVPLEVDSIIIFAGIK